MHFLNRCILSAAALTVSASAFAALPDAGLWAIDDEVNGKPGRGIQIDRQGGETVIASYYGYRADGAAVFYQAVGKITDGKTFNADLIEYKGGTVIGGSVKDATEAKTIGPMQAVFSTDTSGSVTLPGSEPQAFSRFVYEDHSKRLNNTFAVIRFNPNSHTPPLWYSYLTIEVTGNKLNARYRTEVEPSFCSFNGDLFPEGISYSSSGIFGCDEGIATSAPVYYRFRNLKVDDKGVLTGTLRTGFSMDRLDDETAIVGGCVDIGDAISGPINNIAACSPAQLGLTAKPE